MRIIYKYDFKKNDFFEPKPFFVKEFLLKKKKKNSNEDIVSNDFDFTSNDFKSFKFIIKKKKVKMSRFDNIMIK